MERRDRSCRSDPGVQGRPLLAPATALAGHQLLSPPRSSAHHTGERESEGAHAVRAVGLYDPAYEHDACGVAFVARLDGVASHETLVRAATALANLEHRGAEGADAGTGDGAGMTLQLPDALFRAEVGSELPPLGSYGVAVCFLPRDAGRAADARAAPERDGRGRGAARGGVARRPCRREPGRAVRGCDRSARPPALRRGRAGTRSRRVRAQAVCDPPRRGARSRTRPRDPELLCPDGGLQGDADGAAADRLLPRPPRRAHSLRARARALALLDEHVPELGARPPVPDDRPQRRDQHAAGQRQLDARARVAAGVGAVRRRPGQGLAGRTSRRLGLGDLRQRARAARARRPVAAARDHDDDPRGVSGPRRRLARARRVLRLPPVPARGLGRPGGDRLHGRAADRGDARPQRPASRPLARDRRRLGRARLGDRCPRGGAGERRPEGAAAAREALPRRPRAGPDRPGRGGQARDRVAAALRRLVRKRTSCGWTTCRRARACLLPPSRCASANSHSATRRTT